MGCIKNEIRCKCTRHKTNSEEKKGVHTIYTRGLYTGFYNPYAFGPTLMAHGSLAAARPHPSVAVRPRVENTIENRVYTGSQTGCTY